MIRTRLTERFGLAHPVISAPMAFAAGGRLAAAVTRAGGLGLIGGGYGDPEWVAGEFAAAGNARVGCGFITWALAERPAALEVALGHAPAALFLSFGDPAPFYPRIAEAGVPLIAQVQTLRDAAHAADTGAAVVVAQGSEAGGHGEKRATLTLVPEVADWLARRAPEVLLVAAGGIADGRGLAAALVLGADGVLVGSRLWASEEARVAEAMHAAALAASGDDTIRTDVMDVARGLDWPARYSCRVLQERVHRALARRSGGAARGGGGGRGGVAGGVPRGRSGAVEHLRRRGRRADRRDPARGRDRRGDGGGGGSAARRRLAAGGLRCSRGS